VSRRCALTVLSISAALVCPFTVEAQSESGQDLHGQRELDAWHLSKYASVQPELAQKAPLLVAGFCAAAERVAARGENAPETPGAMIICAAAIRGMVACDSNPDPCGLFSLELAEQWPPVVRWLEWLSARGLAWGQDEARGAEVVKAHVETLRRQTRPVFVTHAPVQAKPAALTAEVRPADSERIAPSAQQFKPATAGASEGDSSMPGSDPAQAIPPVPDTPSTLGVSVPSTRASSPPAAHKKRGRRPLPSSAANLADASAPNSHWRAETQAIYRESQELQRIGRGEMSRLREAQSADEQDFDLMRACADRMHVHEVRVRALEARLSLLPREFGNQILGAVLGLQYCVACGSSGDNSCREVGEGLAAAREAVFPRPARRSPRVRVDQDEAPPESHSSCCKICTKGCACGDSCISCSYTCHKGPGCACDG
jgi:hypothetical protein